MGAPGCGLQHPFPAEEVVRDRTLITAVSAVGRIVSSALTGTLTSWGCTHLPFLAPAPASLLTAFLLAPQPLKAGDEVKAFPHSLYVRVRRQDVLVSSLLGIVNQYILHTVALGFLPLLSRQAGASDMRLSLLATVYQVSLVIGNLLSGGLSARFISGSVYDYPSGGEWPALHHHGHLPSTYTLGIFAGPWSIG